MASGELNTSKTSKRKNEIDIRGHSIIPDVLRWAVKYKDPKIMDQAAERTIGIPTKKI